MTTGERGARAYPRGVPVAVAGRRVVLTGASRGLGSVIAPAFHAARARVALVARDKAALEELAGRLGDARDEDMVAGFFAAGQDEGTFHLDDLRLTTLGFLGMHNSTYQWIRPDGRLTPQRISQVYCRIFFEGIGVRARAMASSEKAVAALRPLLAPLAAH